MRVCHQMTNIYSSMGENHALKSTPSTTHHLYTIYTEIIPIEGATYTHTCTYRTAKIEVCKTYTQHSINMRSRIIHAIKNARLHRNTHITLTNAPTVQYILSWSDSNKELYRYRDGRNTCLTWCYYNLLPFTDE